MPADRAWVHHRWLRRRDHGGLGLPPHDQGLDMTRCEEVVVVPPFPLTDW